MRWPDIEKISRWLLFSGRRHCVMIGRERERERETHCFYKGDQRKTIGKSGLEKMVVSRVDPTFVFGGLTDDAGIGYPHPTSASMNYGLGALPR